MKKDFEKWNKTKQQINDRRQVDAYEKEIWWCALGENIGIEISGKGDSFERPVLVFKVFNREMAWVLPITSSDKESYFYYRFELENEESAVVFTQIRTISTKRLIRKIGVISEIDFKDILERLWKVIKNETPLRGNLGGRSPNEANGINKEKKVK